MNHLRRVAVPAWVMVAILVVFPILDLVQGVWPVRMGDVSWRVASVGLFSRAMLTPILGLVVAYAAALLLEQRRVVRTMAVLNGLMTVVLLAVLGFYALDAVELRARLASENRNYDLGIGFSFLKYGFGLAMLLVLTVSEWRTAGTMRRGSRRQAESGGVVFRAGDRTAEASADAEPVEGD